jgi:hypothetical protein
VEDLMVRSGVSDLMARTIKKVVACGGEWVELMGFDLLSSSFMILQFLRLLGTRFKEADGVVILEFPTLCVEIFFVRERE